MSPHIPLDARRVRVPGRDDVGIVISEGVNIGEAATSTALPSTSQVRARSPTSRDVANSWRMSEPTAGPSPTAKVRWCRSALRAVRWEIIHR
jgi:hypothetical protein